MAQMFAGGFVLHRLHRLSSELQRLRNGLRGAVVMVPLMAWWTYCFWVRQKKQRVSTVWTERDVQRSHRTMVVCAAALVLSICWLIAELASMR